MISRSACAFTLALTLALIDRKVNKYFTELDALVRKIEKDKYFVVLKYQYLAKLREDRFSLIEDVKTVKVGNEMAVTLSIGIGANGESLHRIMSMRVCPLTLH